MKIGLIDVDENKFPNLALMKLSAWHKELGDAVEWWNGLVKYDRVYMSKVFDEIYTADMSYAIQETNNRNYGGKSTKYHYKKWQTAKKKEITLMHVWDVDWQDDDRKEKIKDIVVSLLSGHPIEEVNHNTLMFYEYKTRSVIEHKPDDYDALREKCISGKAARYFTCGISI